MSDRAMPEELMDTMIVRAIEDALQGQDIALQQEARAWLWICCPDVADQLDLPHPHEGGMAAITAYTQRQPLL
jgi:hypothetical protein